jgi:heme/copper-type cytochrome/quinol oxidase subunit 2
MNLRVVVLAVLGAALAGCSSAPVEQPATTTTSATVALKTVTLGASSPVSVGTFVTYSCAHNAEVKVCGPDEMQDSTWTRKIAFPVGTTVRVQVAGGDVMNRCWISDESDRLKFAEANNGDCSATVE